MAKVLVTPRSYKKISSLSFIMFVLITLLISATIGGWPDGSTVNVGDILKLTCIANANAYSIPTSYEWYKDERKVGTSATYIKTVTKEDVGSYRCKIIHDGNNSGSTDKTLTVKGKSAENVDVGHTSQNANVQRHPLKDDLARSVAKSKPLKTKKNGLSRFHYALKRHTM